MAMLRVKPPVTEIEVEKEVILRDDAGVAHTLPLLAKDTEVRILPPGIFAVEASSTSVLGYRKEEDGSCTVLPLQRLVPAPNF